jgi:hypothetical protein
MPHPTIYSQDYIKKCFDAWYLSGRPNAPTRLREIVPIADNGKKPSIRRLNAWRVEGAWDAWADDLDARAIELSDEVLIHKKAQMLKDHLEQAEKITAKALEHIIADGFDSSSAAVNAFFKGLEEQRKTQGFSDLLERLEKMTNNEVENQIYQLLQRASDNDQVIDAPAEEVPELEDTEE